MEKDVRGEVSRGPGGGRRQDKPRMKNTKTWME